MSVTLVAVATGSFVAGIVAGGLVYLGRSSRQEEHVAGTAAWWPHAGLLLLTVVLVALVRRRHPDRLSVLLAPVGKRAARRVRHTLGEARRRPTAALRVLAAVIPAVVLIYGPFRAGMQVLGGLDPNFVINAWGGPTYLGAMACHYLDGALLMAVAAWLIGRLLLPDPVAPPANNAS